jgi:hypothetical protein
MAAFGELKWYFWCDECSRREDGPMYQVPDAHGYVAPQPGVPENWSVVGGKHYCEQHALLVVEGKTTVIRAATVEKPKPLGLETRR